MKRGEIINALIEKFGYKSYLEIGVDSGNNFRSILSDRKVGVDPNPAVSCTHNITSDEFFRQNKETFDIIFIDGLHEAGQVIKDVENSLKVLNEGGTIVMHDCNPPNEMCQRVPRETVQWTGDTWKAFVCYRQNPELDMFVIDTDWGVGVVRAGNQKTVDAYYYGVDYSGLEKNRKEWLNLKSVEEFKIWLNGQT